MIDATGPIDTLYATSGNPIPPEATVGRLTAADGLRLRYALFKGQARPLKGTVVLLTGRNECIEKYFETIGDLQARGFGVAIMDWRGQGGSGRLLKDRHRGHVASFDDYVADLGLFFETVVLPDCRAPFFVLAHSAGGLIALLSAPLLVNRVRRMVLSTPLLELTGLPISMRNVERLSALLYAIGLGTTYFGGGRRPPGGAPFATNTLTSDPVRYARNQAIYDEAPTLTLGSPTAGWIHAACDAARRALDPEFANAIRIPILMVAAGADEVVSTRAIEAYAMRLRLGSAATVDGARHELLQETDRYREQLFAAFDAFIPGDDPEDAAMREAYRAEE